MKNNNITQKYQLIDDESCFRLQQLEGLAKQKIQNFGKQYHIVSIIGSQSSGKSTLLNAIFNTEFDVLNRKKRVGQTTKGIWYSLDMPSKIIVLDVEGSDSNQRQERIKIERRNSLFALAVSHTLLINLWIQQIGLYRGSQLAILEIILELNLKLFGSERPKEIIFVVRDFMAEQENQKDLRQKLFLKVEEAWNKIPKPPGKQNIKLKDLFNLQAFFLPSKIEEKQKFMGEVEKVRGYLLDHSKKNDIVKDNVPMKDFPLYIQNLWTTIESDKDINLPQQKIMLSNMRCHEVQKKIYQDFQQEFRDELQRTERIVNLDFAKNTKAIVNKMIASYNEQTSGYIKQEVEKIREEFIQFLERKIQLSFLCQIRMISQESIKVFIEDVNKSFLKDKNIENIKNIKPEVIKKFEDQVKQISYSPEWVSIQVEKFIKSIDDAFEHQKQKIISDSLKDFDRTIKKQIEGIVSNAFYDKKIFSQNFWGHINTSFKEISSKAKNSIVGLSKKLQIKEKGNLKAQLNDHILKAKFNAEEQLKTIILMKCNDLLYYIIRHFSVDFNTDEKQIPRQWVNLKPEEITELYEKYKTKYLKLLQNFNTFNLKEVQQEPVQIHHQKPKLNSRNTFQSMFVSQSNDLMKSKDLMNAKKSIEEQMKNIYEEALKKNKQVYSGSIPTWGWVVLLLVAFDDILLWMHSPTVAIPLTIILILVAAVLLFGGKSAAGNIIDTAKRGATGLIANFTTRAATQMLKKD